MSENIDKNVELSEEELRQAAGGRRTLQSDAFGPVVLHPRTRAPKTRQHEGELDGQAEVQL